MCRGEILAFPVVRLKVSLTGKAIFLASCPPVKATFVILLVICRSVCRDMYVKSSVKDSPVVQ